VFLNSDLVLARNEVLFLTDGDDPPALGQQILRAHFRLKMGVIFSPYTWNLKGNLRNLRRHSFRSTESPFLFLCDHEEVFASGPLNKDCWPSESKVICALSFHNKFLPIRHMGQLGR
jgi:hypothetical protein